MTGPRLTPLAQSLPATVPFVGPEEQERNRGAAFAARLGANESVFGPSPKAIAAMQATAGEIWLAGKQARQALSKQRMVVDKQYLGYHSVARCVLASSGTRRPLS